MRLHSDAHAGLLAGLHSIVSTATDIISHLNGMKAVGRLKAAKTIPAHRAASRPIAGDPLTKQGGSSTMRAGDGG